LAAGLGVADRVEWRLGFLPDEAIPRLMAEATLVALPYRKIDSSGVLATALGHGRPAVVTDVGGLGNPIRDFGAGRVVPPEEPQAFAAALRELLAEDELAKAYAGAQKARHALTWDAAAAAHEAVYREVAR
jgi:glycosyltransferase involved in cell wall biosynthesis